MPKTKVGDLFEIKLDSYKAICWIFWVSKIQRGAFGFVIQDIIKNDSEYDLDNLCQKKPVSIKIPKGAYKEIYSDTIYFKRYEHWNIIDHKDGININLKHIIGCNLYNGDEYIRNLATSESHQYRTFMSCGYKAVENIISYYIDSTKNKLKIQI